jgi:hypothetical protein
MTLDLQRPNEYEWPVIVRRVHREIQLVPRQKARSVGG